MKNDTLALTRTALPFLALLGCGGFSADSDGLQDGAPLGDADPLAADADPLAPDAMGGDAMLGGLVDVQVFTDFGYRAPNTPVLVQGADGTFKSRTLTDSNGHAQVAVTRGEQITCLVDSGSQRSRVTFVAVEPGDTLTVGEEFEIGAPPVGSIQLSTIPFSGPASAYAFDVGAFNFYGGFASFMGGLWVSEPIGLYPPEYLAGTDFPVVAYALDAADKPLAFRLGTANTASSTFTFTSPGRTDLLNLSLRIDHTAAGQVIDLDGYLGTPQLHHAFGPIFAPTSGGAVDVTLKTVPEIGNAFTYGYTLRNQASTHYRAQAYRDAAPLAAGHMFAEADLLPEINGVTLDTVQDQNRPLATIDISGNDRADYGRLSLGWQGTVLERWIFVFPPDATVVKAPALSPDDAAFLPAGAAIRVRDATFVFSSTLASYAQARRLAVPARSDLTLPDLARLAGTDTEWTSGFTAFRGN